MPRKLRAAGGAVNSLSTNLTYQYRGLWITDALLEETFQRFCHSSRRYGSNVPGPLEARKRASKRRNTSLAYANVGGQPVYDPAVMLGSGPKEKWWSKYDAPKTKSQVGSQQEKGSDDGTSSLFLPWFLKPPDPPSTPVFDPLGRSDCERTVETEWSASDIKRLELQLKHRISRATSLKSIQEIIQDMKLDLRQSPKLSEVVFRQILKTCERNGSYDQMALALCDPSLHSPDSSNHLICVRHICSGQVSRKKWETQIFLPLLKAVELGLVSANDLQRIILLVPEVRKDLPAERVDNKVHSDWHRLLTSIEHSRVLQPADMNHNFLLSWYQLISRSPQTESSCLLRWRLRAHSGLSEMGLASDLTIKRLTDVVDDSDGGHEKLVTWLRMLPVNLQWSNVIQTTFKLILAVRDDQSQSPEILHKWSELLPRLRSEHLQEFPIDQAMWTEAAIMPCGLSSSEQLLSALWIAIRLWSACPDAAYHFESTRLRRQFENVFKQIDNVSEFDRISQVVLTLDMLPLPGKDEIFSYLQHFSDEELIKLLGHEEYANGLKACLRLEYAQLQHHHLVKQAKYNYPQVLTALAESINTDLPEFQAMAQTLILRSSENYRIIKRLLDHNMKLKFALCRSWDIGAIEDKKNHSGLDKTAVLDMVEKLIVTFSITPVVSSRASFKYVCRMYSFLHRVGAPIRPIVGRALWHAGVTRYGQAGAPHAQVSWCLAKIREIEGEKVAKRLLRSAGFRKAYVQEYVDTVKSTSFPIEVDRSSIESGRQG